MGTENTTEDAVRKTRMHTRLSALTIMIGFVLMIRQMYADSEPGAIPLLLIIVGIGWYVVTRVRSRSQRK